MKTVFTLAIGYNETTKFGIKGLLAFCIKS